MRNLTVDQADRLFNLVEYRKDKIIAYKIGDETFVRAHFPHHEFAARRTVTHLSALQQRLMDAAYGVEAE